MIPWPMIQRRFVPKRKLNRIMVSGLAGHLRKASRIWLSGNMMLLVYAMITLRVEASNRRQPLPAGRVK